MNSAERFSVLINDINELAAQLDPAGRSFIFLEWNPLYHESDTAESNFWREWINLHILFRECRPGEIPESLNTKYSGFFDHLGYDPDELQSLYSFVKLLRYARLYRCHPNLGIVQEHESRMEDIKSAFKEYAALSPLSFHGWQIRATETDWQAALSWLYAEAERHLVRLKTALENVTSDTRQAVLKGWISMYAGWLRSRNAQDLFVDSAILNFFRAQAETNGNLIGEGAERVAIQNLRFFKNNADCTKALAKQYRMMENYSTFEAKELTQKILENILPTITKAEPRIIAF